MTHSVSVDVTTSNAAYSSNDRVFSRVTFTVTDSTNMSQNIFVVDTSAGVGNYKLMYVATPADLQNIPDDSSNGDNLRRVDSVSLDYDNQDTLTEIVADIQARVKLLVSTLDKLDIPDENYSFVAGE